MTRSDVAALFVTALVLTVVLMPMAIWALRRASLADTAGERSSHRGTVARGGGVALIASMGFTLLIFQNQWDHGQGIGHAIWLGLAMGLIGLLDDVISPPAVLRLGLQLAIVVVFVLTIPESVAGPLAILTPLSIGLWLLSLTNAFNFMDGINGITATSALVIGVGLTISSLRWDAMIGPVAAAVAGTSAGFLPFNAPKARVFLGDVGSYGLGSLLAALAIVGYSNGVPLITVALPFGLYLADTGVTLLRRISARQPLLSSHRDHTYQRLVHLRGWSQMSVTSIAAALTAILCVLGHLGAYSNAAAGFSLALAAFLLSGYLWLGLTA